MTRVLITGATDGIGLATARALSTRGAEVVVHGRNPGKLARVADELDADGVLGDLSSMAQVRSVADMAREHGPYDVLLHNAGVYASEHVITDDGFELSMAVNHFAPFLLTHLLLDDAVVDGGRVVTVSSIAHSRGRMHWDDLELRQGFSGFAAYAQSKLANVLFANALARRVADRGITSNSLHPGVIDTKLLRAGFAIAGDTVDAGAETSVFLALSPDVQGKTGGYYDACREVPPSPSARSKDAQEKLWFRSGARLGVSVS